MKNALLSAVPVVLGLTLANYGYQFFNDANWNTAFERSFFQWIAIILTVCAVSFRQKKNA